MVNFAPFIRKVYEEGSMLGNPHFRMTDFLSARIGRHEYKSKRQDGKQEPNFKIKELRLKDFDEKARLIGELIRQTERVIDEQTIFFASATDYGLKQTVCEVREGLRESAHGLIARMKEVTSKV